MARKTLSEALSVQAAGLGNTGCQSGAFGSLPNARSHAPDISLRNGGSAKRVASHRHFVHHEIAVYRLRRSRVWAAFFAERERLAALRLLAARLL